MNRLELLRLRAERRAAPKPARAPSGGRPTCTSAEGHTATYCLIASIWISRRMLSGMPGTP